MATTASLPRPATSYWIIATLLALWGAVGVAAFYADVSMTDAARQALPDYDRQLLASRPAWVVWMYGIATWGSLATGLLLLARRRLAVPAAIGSLAAVLLQFGWVFGMTDLLAVKGAAATVPFPAFIIAVALFQLWFARRAARRGTLG